MSLCWIAGWPHCGSTLLRTLLKDVFGLQTYSKYKEEPLIFLFGDSARDFGENWKVELYARCRDRQKLTLVKTHEFPIDNEPAIYITRDGRDAATSLARFWDISVHDVLEGKIVVNNPVYFGGWGEHYRAWNPIKRSNTLLVKFGEILEQPDETIARLAEFLKLPVMGTFVDRFDEHKSKWPRMYEDKNDELRNVLQGDDLELFWQINGDVMKELHYIDEIPTGDNTCVTASS